LFHDGHRTCLTDLFLYGLIFDYKMLQSCLSLMNCLCMCELTPTQFLMMSISFNDVPSHNQDTTESTFLYQVEEENISSVLSD
jgi:hypothetical protein